MNYGGINTDGLPDEVLEELSGGPRGNNKEVLDALKESGAQEFNADIVLVVLYRKRKIIMKRMAVHLCMSRLKKAEYIESAGKQGWFKWPSSQPEEHICGIPERELQSPS